LATGACPEKNVYLAIQAGELWTDAARHAEQGPIYGLTAGYQLNCRMSTELNVLSSRHDLQQGGKLYLTALTADLVLSVRDKGIVIPFGVVGIGVIHDEIASSNYTTAFVAEMGAGLRLLALEGSSFTFNIVPQVRARWDAYGLPAKGSMLDWYGTLGLQWIWGPPPT
jgi:hypothetical protein